MFLYVRSKFMSQRVEDFLFAIVKTQLLIWTETIDATDWVKVCFEFFMLSSLVRNVLISVYGGLVGTCLKIKLFYPLLKLAKLRKRWKIKFLSLREIKPYWFFNNLTLRSEYKFREFKIYIKKFQVRLILILWFFGSSIRSKIFLTSEHICSCIREDHYSPAHV